MTGDVATSVGRDPHAAADALLTETLKAAVRAGTEPDFVAALRAEARAVLETAGFPKPKDEAWRFTPLGSVLRVGYRPAKAASDGTAIALQQAAFSLPGASRVLLVNGIPHLVGGTCSGASVEVGTLADALSTSPASVAPYLGKIAPLGDGFAAQNAALFTDGLVIVAKAGAPEQTVHVVHASTQGSSDGPTLSTPRLLVIAERGSALRLIETDVGRGPLTHLENSVTEIAIGDSARVTHIRVGERARPAARVAQIAVRQGRGSRYESRVFALGGALERHYLRVLLDGDGAECSLDGLYLSGEGELVAHHTWVDHAVPGCTSRQRYKGILDGDGVAVFDGTVVVRRGAVRTAAHQENRNLLLSGNAVVHAKPHLEIDADDVKCSHGATVGRLDPNELFYLRSRGLELELARSLLTYSFAREVVRAVDDPVLERILEDRIAARLPDGLRAKELA
ncbi:MAG TPA: Fe-S cluster assembly protein SufD [Polyangiaceae bacterium]|jgi:Fe-S cluster assembly protein SufD|nr:Fe-S cluster assembly protein SufD [Polyangiaceae bacterium]